MNSSRRTVSSFSFFLSSLVLLLIISGVAPIAAPGSGNAAALPLPGDTMADALPISSLPFDTLGSTLGYVCNNYGDMCPYGYLGPDVVYRYDAVEEFFAEVSLCNEGTDFDTNLYVYRNWPGPLVACSEDGCSAPGYPDPWLSRIRALHVQPGNTYFIVVSGYGGDAGNYHLTMDRVIDPFYVLPDGSGAFPTIDAAIGAAEDGQVIELADGIFSGWGNFELHYGGKAITVRSRNGNPEACLIDAGGLGRGFIFDGEGPASVLEGVTIENGFDDTYNGGGGMICFEASPTIRNCIFSHNRAEHGGACGLDWARSAPVFEGCRFLDNQAVQDGGAVYGMQLSTDHVARFLGCTFAGNVAGSNGGALAFSSGRPELAGCTVVKNAANAGSGGGIYAPGHGAVLQNTIIALNRGAGIGGAVLGGGSVACCDSWRNDGGNWGLIPDPTGTAGNISLDPLFCDYENRDFRLAEDSPCRPYSPPNPECDLVGAWPVACGPSAVGGPVSAGTAPGVSAAPSPFSGTCRISCGGVSFGRIGMVSVHDPSGRVVRRFLLGSANSDEPLLWDGRDDAGRRLPAGVYLIRLTAAGKTSVARVILAPR